MHDESNLSESANDRFVPRVMSKKSKFKCDSRYLETFLGENQPHKNGGVKAVSQYFHINSCNPIKSTFLTFYMHCKQCGAKNLIFPLCPLPNLRGYHMK